MAPKKVHNKLYTKTTYGLKILTFLIGPVVQEERKRFLFTYSIMCNSDKLMFGFNMPSI